MFPGAWSVLPCLQTAIRRQSAARCFSAASQPQAYVACLEDVRGVVRLSGSGVLQFLQVCCSHIRASSQDCKGAVSAFKSYPSVL